MATVALFVPAVSLHADEVVEDSVVFAVGNTIDLFVLGMDPDATYEWLKGGALLRDNDRIRGSASPHLIIGASTVNDSDIYTLRSWTVDATLETNAIYDVLVVDPPQIQRVFYFVRGDDVVFQVDATGGALTYQWIWQGTDLTGATNSTLIFTNAAGSANAGYYTVRVANVAGSVTGPDPGILFTKPVPSRTYQGLFFDTNAPALESSGSLQMNVSASKRTFSGKVMILNRSYPFSGTLSADHAASVTTSPSRAGDRLRLDLQVLTVNDMPQVVGTIGNDAWNVPFRANRAPYSSASVTTLAGAYTMALVNTNMLPGNDFPDGNGYGTVVVTPSGNVTFKGSAADGASLGLKCKLSSSGEWPLYIPMSKKRGCMIAWVKIGTSSSGAIPTTPVFWMKPSGPDKLYPQGFELTLQGIGSTYISTNPSTLIPFDKGVAVLSGGDLYVETSPEVDFVKVSTVRPYRVASTDAPEKFAVSTKASTGVLSGQFRDLTTGKKTSLKGILLQQQKAAYGYFLSSGASGSFTITAGGWTK